MVKLARELLTLPTKFNRRINITIKNNVLLIDFRKHLVIIITRHSLRKAIKRHRRLILIANLMQASFIGIKVVFSYAKRGNNTGANSITVDRLGYILGNITSRLIRNIANKNKTIPPTGRKKRMMTGDIRRITINQLLRNIKKDAMVVRATM